MVASPWFKVPVDNDPEVGYGGSEAVEAALINELVDMGHDVTLICAGKNKTTRCKVLSTSPELHGIRITLDAPAQIHSAMANDFIDQGEFDIVHEHTTAGLPWAAWRNIPTIATVHIPVTGEWGDFYRNLGKRVGLVSISHSQRSLYPELNWIDTVHNAIQVEHWPFQTEKEDDVLFLGRAHPDKGMDVAIEAAIEAGRRIKIAAKCHEAIEVAYKKEVIDPLILKYGPDKVIWLGEVNTAQKKELLKRAWCLLVPNRWREPFGMVVIEALVCGTPVVVTDLGALPEIVTHGITGYVCSHVSALPTAIDYAGKIDPYICRLDVEDRFSSKAMATGYLRAYEQAIATHPVDLAYRIAMAKTEQAVAAELAKYRNELRLKNLQLQSYKDREAYGHVGTKSRTSAQSR
jgi:glycosyltransferase involved in cell wall biosynthesis